MNNVVSDHADELASWGLGDYGEGTSQYDAPKYTYSSSPAQYEPPSKYGGNGDSGGGPPPPPYAEKYVNGGGPPPSPYAEKYVKRVDNTPVSIWIWTFSNPILFLMTRGWPGDKSIEFIFLPNRHVWNVDYVFFSDYNRQ